MVSRMSEEKKDEGPLIRFRKPRTEGKRVTARGGHAACVVNTDLVFFGGHCYGGKGKFEYHNDTQVLDLESNSWHKVKTGGRTPGPRYGHTAEVIGNKIYIFGGSGPDGKLYNDVFFLDTLSWCWVELSSTTPGPTPRFGHASTVVGDKIVVHGGWDGHQCFDDIWIFDTANNTWILPKTTGRPPSARHGHVMELTIDGRIIVFGGMTTNEKGYPSYLNDVRSLDIETMVWTQPLVTGDYIEPRHAMTSCMLGKYMVIVGGYIQRKYKKNDRANDGVGQRIKKPTTSTHILAMDTETLEWVSPEFFGNCPDDLYGHSISLAGNQVIIYGGWGGNRALDELFVGEGLGAFANSIEEQQQQE